MMILKVMDNIVDLCLEQNIHKPYNLTVYITNLLLMLRSDVLT